MIVGVYLTCDACGVATGPFETYEQWNDAASRLGWTIEEEFVLCALCTAELT